MQVETIGDAYMLVSGATTACEDHADKMIDFAFVMQQAAAAACMPNAA